MQLFFTSSTISECAQDLCNMHLNKQIIECAQMLSTAHHLHRTPGYDADALCKPTHARHPLTRWVCESKENYRTTAQFFEACLDEYHLRRKGSRDHASGRFLEALGFFPVNLPDIGSTPMPHCCNEAFMQSINLAKSVRFYPLLANSRWVMQRYYAWKWAAWHNTKKEMVWVNQLPPEWLRTGLDLRHVADYDRKTGYLKHRLLTESGFYAYMQAA